MIFEVENKKVFSSDIGQTFDKNKHTIILLHGSGQSHVVWSLTGQYLADEGYNVFALDLPGHGNSEGSSLESIEDMADWLNKVVKVIGIKEISSLLNKQSTLEQTKELIAIKTRQYAKRQVTWARGQMQSWQKINPKNLSLTLKKLK